VILDLDVGTVERANCERAIHRELHIAGARGFHARRRDLLGKVRRRDDPLGIADIVVGHVNDLEQAAHRGIGIDPPGDVVCQFDDQLGVVIARCGLAAEDLHARHPVPLGMAADLVVERHRLDQVKQLALVFMDTLDLHVEHRVGIEANAHRLLDVVRQRHFVGALHFGDALTQHGIAGHRIEIAQLGRVIEEGIADRILDRRGQTGIALLQPAARRDTVGLVVDPRRIEIVQVSKDRDLHQVGVQRGHAVDRMRAGKGEVGHAHPPLAAFVDQRNCRDCGIIQPSLARLAQHAAVDRIDDLHVARQQPLE